MNITFLGFFFFIFYAKGSSLKKGNIAVNLGHFAAVDVI